VGRLWFEIYNLTSPDVSLRMDYSAANQTVTNYFDGDGATGGYDWVAQGTANLANGAYNRKMGANDSFTLVLVASSKYQTVATGQAWFDNLRVTVGGAGNTPEIVVQQPSGYPAEAAIDRT
jgi:hypothetical protein